MVIRPPKTLFSEVKESESPFMQEMLVEQAATLKRQERLLKKALRNLQMRKNEENLENSSSSLSQLVDVAAQQLHAYVITREIIGFRSHEDVYVALNVPEKVIARQGATLITE